MCVPINELKAVMQDIVTRGQPNRPARPWLGVYATEVENKVVLMGVADRGPAKRADLRSGDVVVSIGGNPVVDLAGFYRGLWALGVAGVEAPMVVQREGRRLDVVVTTVDRSRLSNSPRLH